MSIDIQQHVPLGPLTTFQIGGPARWYVTVSGEDEIKEALQYARDRNIHWVLLAGSSNVLLPDEGIHALVIHITEGRHVFSSPALRTDAGCNLLHLIEEAAKKRLGGWEKLAGIPGTIGGAVRGNAGAFGSEIKDFVTSVRIIDTETLEGRGFVHPYMDFSYRNSTFKHHPEWIITSVTFELSSVKQEESKALIAATIAEREKRHLQNVRAAGSFFMNPIASAQVVAMFEKEKKVKSRENRVPAGWLIEKAGMKGAQVGGAQASLQHPNYIVNVKNAKAADVLELAAQIRAKVKEQFDVELKEEAAVFHNLTT